MIDLRGEMQKARLALNQLMRSDSFSAEAGKKAFKKLQDALNTLIAERFDYVVSVRELLGADRYRKLKTVLRNHRREARQDRRGGKGRRMAYMPAMDAN